MVLCTILMNSQRSKTKFQTTLDQSCIDLCVESDWGLVSFSSSRVGFPCYSQAPMPLWFTGFLQWGSPSDHGLQCESALETRNLHGIAGRGGTKRTSQSRWMNHWKKLKQYLQHSAPTKTHPQDLSFDPIEPHKKRPLPAKTQSSF